MSALKWWAGFTGGMVFCALCFDGLVAPLVAEGIQQILAAAR